LNLETFSGVMPDVVNQSDLALPNADGHEPYSPELTIAAADFMMIAGDHATSELNSHGADQTTGSSHENEREFMSSRAQMSAVSGRIIFFPLPDLVSLFSLCIFTRISR